jgi:hypothetical protein
MLGDGFTYISLLMLKFVMNMNVMFYVERLMKLLRSANVAKGLEGQGWVDRWGRVGRIAREDLGGWLKKSWEDSWRRIECIEDRQLRWEH